MALSTQPQGKLLDYEQYIDHQLGRTRARIKITDVVTGSLILVAAALAVLFLEVVLDHTIGLPLWCRRIILFLGLTGGLAFAIGRIVLPLVSRVNGLYAARTIEESDPSFKNSLINYLDLRRRRQDLMKGALAAIEAKAVNDLTQIEVESVVNQRRLTQMAYVLSGVVVLFCLYAAMTPKSILDSTRRALFLADVVRPTNTRLVNIRPGDDPELKRVVAGALVEFTVDYKGARPDKIFIHYSVDGGKFFAKEEMAPGINYYDSWRKSLRDVQQSIEYYLTGGDAESLHYHIEVLPAPMVTAVSLDYEFPGYIKLPPRISIEGGNVEAIEGTLVTVHARTNQPARSGRLEFSKSAQETIDMEVATADPYALTGRFKVDKSGSYTIKFLTTGKQANPDPVVWDIIALPDKPPTAQFIRPDQPVLKRPSNVKVLLVMTAADDHGVKDVTLHARQGDESLLSLNLLENKPATPKFRGEATFDLEAWKVQPGSKIDYWLTVRDTKEPTSNRFETARQVIEVLAPVPEKERVKLEQTAQQETEPPPQPPSDAERDKPAADPDEPPPPNATQTNQEGDQSNLSPGPQGGVEPPPKRAVRPIAPRTSKPKRTRPSPRRSRSLPRSSRSWKRSRKPSNKDKVSSSNRRHPRAVPRTTYRNRPARTTRPRRAATAPRRSARPSRSPVRTTRREAGRSRTAQPIRIRARTLPRLPVATPAATTRR